MDGIELLEQYQAVFPAVLAQRRLDYDGRWRYGWREQTFNPANAIFRDADPGRFGTLGANSTTDNQPAFELNNAAVAVGTYVWMRLRGIAEGFPVYEFIGLSSPSACPVWYTGYLHLATVTVEVGEVLVPGYQIGTLGTYPTGSHLHFSIGDGQDLLNGVDSFVGQTVEVADWLGLPVIGAYNPSAQGPNASLFSQDEIDTIREHTDLPVTEGLGWASYRGSAAHKSYEYYAQDIFIPPLPDQAESGQPIYLAVIGPVLSTVVHVSNNALGIGWAIVVQHTIQGCAAAPAPPPVIGPPTGTDDDPPLSPSIYLVTNVCPVKGCGPDNCVKDVIVEYTLITLPPGTLIGQRICVTSPVDCCPTVAYSGQSGGSGSGPIDTLCCPNTLPPTLYAQVSNVGTATLIWNGQVWTGTVNAGGSCVSTLTLTFSCQGNSSSCFDFQILIGWVGSPSNASPSINTCSCSPLCVYFNATGIPDTPANCPSTVAVLVSDTPDGCANIPTACCPTMPAQLTLTVNANCPACVVGGLLTIELTYNGTWWEGSGAFGTCNRNLLLQLICNQGTWVVRYAFSDNCAFTGYRVLTSFPGTCDFPTLGPLNLPEACCPPYVPTNLCPQAPTQLQVTVHLTGCPCFTSPTVYLLVYDSIAGAWLISGNNLFGVCGRTINIRVTPQADHWRLEVSFEDNCGGWTGFTTVGSVYNYDCNNLSFDLFLPAVPDCCTDACFPNGPPGDILTLYANMTQELCPCLGSPVIPLAWNGSGSWVGTAPFGSCGMNVTITVAYTYSPATGGQFTTALTWSNGCFPDQVTVSEADCLPIETAFCIDMDGFCGCLNNNIILVVITE